MEQPEFNIRDLELVDTKLGLALSIKSKKTFIEQAGDSGEWPGNIHLGYLVKFAESEEKYKLIPYTWETVLVGGREINNKEPEEVLDWQEFEAVKGSMEYKRITEFLLVYAEKQLAEREDAVNWYSDNLKVWEKCLASELERKAKAEEDVNVLLDRL